MEQKQRRKLIVGWIAVSITVLVTNIWAYWGIIENFHEGWYSESIIENLGMLFLQYLPFTIAFCVLAVVSVRWHKAGFILHIGLAVFFAWFFRGAAFQVVGLMIVLPMLLIGLMYFYGRPEPKKWAYRIIIILPLIIILGVTPFKIHQITQRVNDGDFGLRIVEGNGVNLIWAPRGPGWPDGGVTHYEAAEICKYLSEDGITIKEEEQNIWRLPTADEAVRSMMLHNKNAGGHLDSTSMKALYEKTPDKETPLWDPNSKIIYYWVSNEANEEQAYIIVFDGGIFKRYKDKSYGYLSFRAVKNIN